MDEFITVLFSIAGIVTFITTVLAVPAVLDNEPTLKARLENLTNRQ